MLSALKIQNYALIQSLDFEIKAGLNIITGETGTGKSILLGALGLILGNRADTSTLMDPEKKCIIEGRFNLANYNLQSFFTNNDLDWDENSILRREISPNGKSRAFINDTPVTLNILKELGESLVDIHSQHQTLKLADPHFQMGLMDNFARHKPLLDEYLYIYRQYSKLEKEIVQLQEQAASLKKEHDYNIFQLTELQQANLLPHEMEALDEELVLLSNAETIKQTLQSIIFELSDDDSSINNRLAGVKRQIGSITSLHTKLQLLSKRLEDVLIETKDIYNDIEEFQESVTIDAQRMELVNDRIQILNHLLTKHQFKNEIDLINYANALQEKISSTESISDRIVETTERKQLLFKELHTLADNIFQNRFAHVSQLEHSLVNLLKQAGIPDAVVKIDLHHSETLNEFGKDSMEILFSGNKGIKPMPVSQVASGGELSRLMLCFKYILADSIFLPTIIFDEIDSGVSGEVAIKVGQMIKKLSAAHQVICITHLPQVAAMGDHHFVVYKISGEDITVTNIRQINKEERVEEIAKMIGGHKPSLVAIENAKELLQY
jgi:DNA repair protein RecN (Recombination protein N)